MSRPIAESLSLLSETLGNCKTNLKDKKVENVDNIKISDVDEKIAEIQSGPKDNTKITLKKVTFDGNDITNYDQKEWDNSEEVTGNLVIDYEYSHPYYEGYLILLTWDAINVKSTEVKEVKTGSNQIIFNNVSTASDSGYHVLVIFLNNFIPASKILFGCILKNHGE